MVDGRNRRASGAEIKQSSIEPAEGIGIDGRDRPTGVLSAHLAQLPYRPDPFQVEAALALDSGKSTLVAAPTGSGKTLVAECAIVLALSERAKVFYTTPIKALSNQKFRDLRATYGDRQVGLLTGDNSINPQAPIVVMTTEVLRNMLYESSKRLDGLRFVILDEVHYLQDPYRGATWEEVIIHLPPKVKLVCLSATVGNVDEFGSWLNERRGETAVILETARPVPLHPLFAVEDRRSDELRIMPLYSGEATGTRPDSATTRYMARGGHRPGRVFAQPGRADLVSEIAERGELPAIFFIFSRAGCSRAVDSCVRAGLRLTSAEERQQIRATVESRMAGFDDDDLDALGYTEWLAGLEAGISAHHAGMVPAFKETVEELFNKALVKVVFATETLALGVNMPARSVVIESLSKFNGQYHALLTPSEYTQLAGRAGRRGIDDVGYCVTVFSKWVPFERIAEIASSISYSLHSSFRPTYNMAINLVTRYDQKGAHGILEASFAQHQTDRGLALLTAARDRKQATLDRQLTRLKGMEREDGLTRDRAAHLEKEIAKAERRIERKSGGLVRHFDAILLVLDKLEYVTDWTVSREGKWLAGIYSERDLLVAELLRRCDTTRLREPELAAIVSMFTFESRSETAGSRAPTVGVGKILNRLDRLHGGISSIEEDAGLTPCSPPDPGFAETVYRWASGESLDTLLEEGESGGDLVRNAKQVADLCRQIATVTSDARYSAAAGLVDRGIVAYCGV